MLPCFETDDLADYTCANLIFCTDRFLLFTSRHSEPNITDVIFIKFCKMMFCTTWGGAEDCRRMATIFCWTNPFKVLQSVIYSHAIFMVDDLAMRWVAQKGQRQKTMHIELLEFAVLSQRDAPIPLRHQVLYSETPYTSCYQGSIRLGSKNLSFIRYAISAIKTRYVSPFRHLGSLFIWDTVDNLLVGV